MFWVRGVADFFAADAAYMIRDSQVTDAARQLASRLRITVLVADDIARLESLHSSALDFDSEPLALLFDAGHVAKALAAFSGLDQRLHSLLEYRQFDFWVFDQHRNPLQLVAELQAVAKVLDPSNPRHLALLLDCAWLYLLAIAHAVNHVRSSQVSGVDLRLQEYLLGGALGLREKLDLAKLLSELKNAGALPSEVDVDPLPNYYSALRELTTRVLRRPDSVLTALRLLEVGTVAAVINPRMSLRGSLGAAYDDLAAKQAADVVGFLVSAAGLDSQFRARARATLLGEPLPATVEPRNDASSEVNNSQMAQRLPLDA
jgi:hypothetical protein